MLRQAEVGPIMAQGFPIPSNGEETEPGATGPQPIIGYGRMRDILDCLYVMHCLMCMARLILLVSAVAAQRHHFVPTRSSYQN